MTLKRTFGRRERLFIHPFGNKLSSLDQWLIDAYECNKTRELNRISDDDILRFSNHEIIEKIKQCHLSTIELLTPIYVSTKDYDDNNLTDIHIPFIGTMGTLHYCPEPLLDTPPRILAEMYNIENAKDYDPKVNWAGNGFTSSSCINNVIMLLFKDSEIDLIEPTLKVLNESVQQCNESINSIEFRLRPELELAIENKRLEIEKKTALLSQLGLKKAELHLEKTPKRLISLRFFNDFQSVVLYYSGNSQTEDTFSKTQAKALSYLQKQHEQGRLKVPQQEITEAIGSVQPKLRNIFKVTKKGKTSVHPLFKTILCHDNRGNYGIIRLKNS